MAERERVSCGCVCVCGTCLGDYAARRILGRECLNKVDDVEADKSNSEESRRRHQRKVQQKQKKKQKCTTHLA